MYHATRLLRIVLLLCCLLGSTHLHGGTAWAVGESVNGFPNWAERVEHEWINRARVDPQLEMNACGAACAEAACYSVMPPLTWSAALNRAARFHSDEQVQQGYFAHASACTIVSNINSLYPTSCNGAAACACVGGTKACSPTCSDTGQRIALFGSSWSGEIIASPSDPNWAFYLWLFENSTTPNCQFTSFNGHRWLILKSSGAVGLGVSGYSTGDFGPGSAPTKLPSGSHYPQQAASVAAWANWYDNAGPSLASINVDGNCTAMTLGRGTQTNGAWTTTVTGVGSGCHRYYFSFADAAGTIVTYPTTGSLAIGSGAACPDWDTSRPAACGVVATAPPSASATPTPTPSPTPPPTKTRTPTPTASPTKTPTLVPTATSSTSPTRTPSSVATATPSAAPTNTPSSVPTATPSVSPTTTASHSPTPTAFIGADVSGSVYYDGTGIPVPQVTMHAAGPTTTSTVLTDTSGNFLLADLPAEDIVVTPSKSGDLGNAVSTLDASYVLQSVLGGRSLSPEQQKACDVTGNGSLSALDASMILRYRVGLITQLPVATTCGSEWIFFPNPAPAANQTLLEPDTNANGCESGAIAYEPLAGSSAQQNFSAVLYGDCTGNWQPPGGGGSSAQLSIGRAGAWRALHSGRVALPISADGSGPLYSLDIRIEYDAALLRPLSARRAGAARGAAVAMNAREPGVARIALARAEAMDTRRGPLLIVVFDVTGHHHLPAPSVTVRADEN